MDYQFFRQHILDILEYWRPAADFEEGSIHFVMNDFGEGPDKQETKCLLMHARQLYNFSVGASMEVPGCAEIAHHLYHTLDIFASDAVPGLYNSIYKAKRRYRGYYDGILTSYNHFYVVVGMAKYAELFKNRDAYFKAKNILTETRKLFIDEPYSSRGCYFLYNIQEEKRFMKSGNAMLHHYEAVVDLYLAAKNIFTGNELEQESRELNALLNESNQLFVNYIYHSEHNITIESFEEDLSMTKDQLFGSVTNGHAVEWIGFLYEGEMLSGEPFQFLRQNGEKLAEETFQRAYTDNGCFRNDYFLQEKRSYQSSTFWGQSEAILGALFAARLYGPKYMAIAERITDFYQKYFFDREFGGIFSTVSADGIVIERGKGYHFKCDHHSLRICDKILHYQLLD